MLFTYERTENIGAEMVPLYAVLLGDLGPGDFVKIDGAACCRRLLRSSAELRCPYGPARASFLARLGLGPRYKVLDLKDREGCRGYGAQGRAVVSIKWAKSVV
jgi:hypothetical protein